MIFLHVAVFKISPQARDQVVDIPVVVQTQIPMVRFTKEILQLQYIDQVVHVCCAGPASSCPVVGNSRDHSCSPFLLDSCCMPVVCNDRCPWSLTSRSSPTVVDVLVITQRRLYSGSASDSVHRQSPWTVQLCNRAWYSTFSNGGFGGDEGVFDAFCVIFCAPPVVPELSASFSSFRALTTVSA